VPEATAPTGQAAIGVEAVLAEVFAGIAELGELAAALPRTASAEDRSPTTEDLATLRPAVLRRLDESEGLLAGTGVIAAPGVLADRPRWLEWWRRPCGAGRPCPLQVDLDPGSVAAYEYPAAEWFDVPRRTGRRVVAGPYVDYAGTDEYILTFAVPVHGDRGFFGVAAADIRASDFERTVLPLLESEGGATLLVNAYGRVIASNTPEAISGSLLPAEGAGAGKPLCRLPLAPRWADCVGLPWSLVRP
jgi:hypothetical protein